MVLQRDDDEEQERHAGGAVAVVERGQRAALRDEGRSKQQHDEDQKHDQSLLELIGLLAGRDVQLIVLERRDIQTEDELQKQLVHQHLSDAERNHEANVLDHVGRRAHDVGVHAQVGDGVTAPWHGNQAKCTLHRDAENQRGGELVVRLHSSTVCDAVHNLPHQQHANIRMGQRTDQVCGEQRHEGQTPRMTLDELAAHQPVSQELANARYLQIANQNESNDQEEEGVRTPTYRKKLLQRHDARCREKLHADETRPRTRRKRPTDDHGKEYGDAPHSDLGNRRNCGNEPTRKSNRQNHNGFKQLFLTGTRIVFCHFLPSL